MIRKKHVKKNSIYPKKKPIGRPKSTRKKLPRGRTADGRVPQGRTMSTYDKYLSGGDKTGSKKVRPVVVIEANNRNELAVVPLSSNKTGKNRTHLKNYQQGQSYFKHYVEIKDNEGAPIRINEKFRENNNTMDVSALDVDRIRKKVFFKSKPAEANRQKIKEFRDK